MANCTIPEWKCYVHSKLFIGLIMLFTGVQIFAQPSDLSFNTMKDSEQDVKELTVSGVDHALEIFS